VGARERCADMRLRPKAPLATRVGMLAGITGLVLASIHAIGGEAKWVLPVTYAALAIALAAFAVAIAGWFWPRNTKCPRCQYLVPESFIEEIPGAGDGGVLSTEPGSPLVACCHCLYGENYPKGATTP
jgi:hypothetical protein